MTSEVLDEFDGKTMTYYTFQTLGSRGPEDWRDNGKVKSLNRDEVAQIAEAHAFEYQTKTRVVKYTRGEYVPVIDRLASR